MDNATDKQIAKIQIMAHKADHRGNKLRNLVGRLKPYMLTKAEASDLITLIEEGQLDEALRVIDQILISDVADAHEWRN